MPALGRLPARKPPKKAYHHGDLRAALIAAAKAEVERNGPDGISLKALAQALGVSQPAPYRHFTDREALLCAVAADGFRFFSSALRMAGEDLHSLGTAYVEFARCHRGTYRLMFASRLVPNSAPDSELRIAARESFEILLKAVSLRARGTRAQRIAFRIWSSLHGLVMLENEGFLATPLSEPIDLDALVRDMCVI